MRKLEKDINSLKIKLLKESIRENWGQDKLNKLIQKHIDSSDYSINMNQKRKLIDNFDNWLLRGGN